MAGNELVFTGERFIPHQTDPILALEHYHRYYFASRFAKNKRVLDMACGEGYGSAFLSRYAEEVVGIDSDPATVDHAREKYSSITNLHFEIGHCEDSPPGNQSFDMVVAFELLEHLDSNDQTKFLKNVRRVLKQEGLFIVSSPDKAEYAETHQSRNEFHKQELTLSELREFLGSHFKYVHLCAQRVLSLSTLWQLEGWQKTPFSFHSRKDLLDDLPDSASFSPPLYIVALCSNSVLPENVLIESNSLYLDVANSDQRKLAQWAGQLNDEIMRGRKFIEELQHQIKERTAWALSLDEETKRQAGLIETMKGELEGRTQWALSLESDVAKERQYAAQEHENYLKERARADAKHEELFNLRLKMSSLFLYRVLAKIKLLPKIWTE
jgi:ubiquinone/menaquinone biosynthesis C-methylase UbiE